MIAHRSIEKVFPADRHSAVAIAGAAGTGHRDGPALPDPARALREGRRHASQPRGQGEPARPDGARATCPWRCRASSSCPCSPATTCARKRAASSPTTSPAAATRRPTSTPPAPAGATPRHRSSSASARLAATRRSSWPWQRSTRPPTRTPPPAGRTRSGASTRSWPPSTPTGYARLEDAEVAEHFRHVLERRRRAARGVSRS